MNFSFRLCLFLGVIVAGLVAYQGNLGMDATAETTRLAVQQFQSSDAVPAQLQQASLAQNWWPLVWPALALVLGVVLLWDDAERWWKRSQQNPTV